MDTLIEIMNQQRMNQHFLTIEETLALTKTNNIILDVFSLLIDRDAKIGEGNYFHPNVVISGKTIIGNHNQFSSGTIIQAYQEILEIGSYCRIDGKVHLYGKCKLGNGSQVLGFIQVYDCLLADGGSYLEVNPDLRGAVLKGTGRAKNLQIGMGQVINGCGDFTEQPVWQHVYHPKTSSMNG